MSSVVGTQVSAPKKEIKRKPKKKEETPYSPPVADTGRRLTRSQVIINYSQIKRKIT